MMGLEDPLQQQEALIPHLTPSPRLTEGPRLWPAFG